LNFNPRVKSENTDRTAANVTTEKIMKKLLAHEGELVDPLPEFLFLFTGNF